MIGKFDAFKSEAIDKAHRLGFGMNRATLLSTQQMVSVLATQPVPDGPVNVTYRIDADAVLESEVVPLFNGD